MSKLLLINDVSSSPFNKFCDNLARSSDCFINLSLFAFDFELKIVFTKTLFVAKFPP